MVMFVLFWVDIMILIEYMVVFIYSILKVIVEL